MRVLITGGTGNLAEFVIAEMQRDYELVLFDRVRPGENRFPFDIRHPYHHGDLTVGEDCARAVAGCQAVLHLGAIPWATDVPRIIERLRSEGRPIPSPDETMRVNTMGTYHVLREAHAAGAQVVVTVTSNCVLGHCMGRPSGRPMQIEYLPIDEEHPTDVEESYGVSKQFQEQLMAGFTRMTAMRTYGIRPAALYRPERQKEWAENYKPAEEWTLSRPFNGYLDVGDAARALRLCLEAGIAGDLPPHDNYYIASADTLEAEPTLEVLSRLRPDLLASVPEGALPGRAAFFSSRKATKAFGWQAESSWTRYLGAAQQASN